MSQRSNKTKWRAIRNLYRVLLQFVRDGRILCSQANHPIKTQDMDVGETACTIL